MNCSTLSLTCNMSMLDTLMLDKENLQIGMYIQDGISLDILSLLTYKKIQLDITYIRFNLSTNYIIQRGKEQEIKVILRDIESLQDMLQHFHFDNNALLGMDNFQINLMDQDNMLFYLLLYSIRFCIQLHLYIFKVN